MIQHVLTESVVEEATIDWLKGLGYQHLPGPDIACDGPHPERRNYSEVVLVERLRSALASLNPDIPTEALEDAFRKVTRPDSPSLMVNNRQFHKMLTEGVDVEYRNEEGRIVGDKVWLVDFANPDRNDWLVVNQFTVIEGQHNRRSDLVVFVNGLPLAVIELKNPVDENATIKAAFNQFQTYKTDIPSLFPYNELLVISDGTEARVGTLTAGWEWFLPWRTSDGATAAPKGVSELEVLLNGMFEKSRFLDLVRHFILFEVDGSRIAKKVAAYHQYHAVNAAVAATVGATSPKGDKRVGVVWHTQGAGKSLTMVFYAGKIVLHPAMENPTLVLLTDRNDLDQQLFGNFALAHDLLRQQPVQAESREHLRDLLKVASGGIVFTTIQKFLPEGGGRFPLLSDRRNIVVIADEAHRSQYDFIDGFARHMRDALPNASFIGFTGTPIEKDDRSTPAVFGDYISIYDIQRAVEDGATVRIFYEGRLAKLELKEEERPHIDPDFEEVTEGEEETVRERLKTKWARLESMVGTEKRIGLVAKDIVEHFEQRLEAIDGKGMIVCMSRHICVDLYDAITKLRPSWHHPDDDKGVIKVVMTGSASDPQNFQPHIRNKERREFIKKRMKDPAGSLKLVIVRDMWLTGFDAPCLHTMYIDKPMRGHGLMQAIARVNRVFRDKPGGLVVDYLGIADELKKALMDYTEGSRRDTGIPQEDAVAIMLEKYEIVCGMFHGFDYSKFITGAPAERLAIIPAAMEHILSQKDGKVRLLQAVTELSKAFALSVPHGEALKIKDDVDFFQTVRAAIAKNTQLPGKAEEELDSAVRQIVSRAVSSDEVVDIFSAASLKKPDISILSDEFLTELQGMPHRNLALELLQKLLNDEIKARARKNLVQSRSFAEMLETTIRRYQNRTIEAAQVILELIELAKQMRDAKALGEKLGLSEEEEAFYDALEVNDSAVKVLGDETLRTIARELVETVRRNVTIDWTIRESVRARLRIAVKRLLRRYGYPPDKHEKATLTVLEQAELLCKDWAG
ncbi:MAG: type I restriction endonuclease subunit R [Chloroflexi bacterium]|nr:type I restriction endonuclease subunit R [Chloroflexota bacterium]MCL5074867.1 type I restriction endonuclease subunit R [Chloroflexota bacterium]